ncbi:MAG TPA: radical SAM protein [Methanocella sp.]|nr:radical SAM protein [Methanocella sp.]
MGASERMQRDNTGSMYNFLCDGCRLCHSGAKMVLFITGVCSRGCFYCPISSERKHADVTYANERKVDSDVDILEEARQMDALGTGITGGEPLARLDRTLYYIRLLKATFGRYHHIHLYTCTAPSAEVLGQLKDAGLDELRMHPPEELWDRFNGSAYHIALRMAIELKISAGIEIPAIKKVPEIEDVLIETGAFLNLNELEFSDMNSEALKFNGYIFRDEFSNAVQGSETLAHEIVLNSKANIRYCSSRFKDAVQLRERLKRTASRMARPFDEITGDGTVVYGEIKGDIIGAQRQLQRLEVPRDMYACIDADRIEIAWWILDDIKEELTGTEKSIVERYPLRDGLVVERIPL